MIQANSLRDGHLYRPPNIVTSAMSALLRGRERALVLTHYTRNLPTLHGSIGRAMPIWEGHTREALDALVKKIKPASGDPVAVCNAVIKFTDAVAVGFTASAFTKVLLAEVTTGCTRLARGKPAKIQALARRLIEAPDHRGAAMLLEDLLALSKTEGPFRCVHFRHPSELRDAIEMGAHPDPDSALAAIAQRRSHRPISLPRCARTSIHKSKGLETDHALVAPIDRANFPDTPQGRHLLYVAISRARKSLTLVVPPSSPSALIAI